jgi:hypothetical protein
MGRVSFSVRIGSVRRSRSPCQKPCHLSPRAPPLPGALHKPGGPGRTRAPAEAAGGAVGTSPLRVPAFLPAPSLQAPGSWKHCSAASPAPDVSLPPVPTARLGLGPSYTQGVRLSPEISGSPGIIRALAPQTSPLAECWELLGPLRANFLCAGYRLVHTACRAPGAQVPSC